MLNFKTHLTAPLILFRYIFLPFLLLLTYLLPTFLSYPSIRHHHLLFFFHFLFIILGSRDSSVGIVTGYGLDDRGVGVRIPVGSRIFCSPQCPHRLLGPPSYSMGIGDYFPGGKAAGP
jgi:hypothetical protein